MRFFRIDLFDDRPDVWLDAYINDPLPGFVRSAMLVIPGGGYYGVCSDREGEPIAMGFIPEGFNCFVLHYSVARTRRFPAQLVEAATAMAHIRAHAAEYGIDPAKVFAVGFSAGGHLAGSLGILWNHPQVREIGDAASVRPDGVILCYPVVSSQIQNPEKGTFANLLCTDKAEPDELAGVSLELHVTEESSPAFIMHTSDDAVVDVRNSLVLADAYRAAGLAFEMHIYPHAPHGAALGNAITSFGNKCWDDPAIARWVADAAAWTRTL